MAASESTLLPVGSVLAYAGALPDLESQGWLACDGRSVRRDKYKELFAAISTAYGAVNQDEFNVPALAGMFLRGVAHGSSKDPTAKDRKALRPGGNTGDAVGSQQPYGTARPRRTFVAVVPRNNVAESRFDAGNNSSPFSWNSNVTNIGVVGGDRESRPVNKYVYYIIKCASRNATGRVVQPPVGSVMPFATPKNPDPAHWVLCDGKAVPTSGEFAALFAAIQFAHGETNEGEMVLPDYRGYFLRGVSASSNIDPNADDRKPPYPAGADGKKGNSGNTVGSQQPFATGAPTSSPFSTNFSSLPKDRHSKDSIGGGVTWLVDGAAWTGVQLSAEGGDDETRPNSVMIDWYLRAR